MSGKWWDTTWNPGHGCTPISPGCANCWAKRTAETRLRGRHGYPADEPFRVVLDSAKLEEPLRWRTPRRVFVWDMGDMFHEDVPDLAIFMVFGVMERAPRHTFHVLTKRPARLRQLLQQWDRDGYRRARLPNVLLGVSVESPAYCWRLDELLQFEGAAGYIVSVEPLLAMINLAPWLPGPHRKEKPSLNWVIVGPETGPGKRPCDPDWITYLAGQCHGSGEYPPVPLWDKRVDGYARELPAVEVIGP